MKKYTREELEDLAKDLLADRLERIIKQREATRRYRRKQNVRKKK